MPVSIGDIVLYTPLPTHRHMMPAWFVKLLDLPAEPGAVSGPVGPIPPCAAIVGGFADAGRYSLVVFVPNQAPVWVDDAEEGDLPGQFHPHAVLLEVPAPTPTPAPPPTPANDASPAAPPAPPPDAAMVGASPLVGTPAPEAS